MHACIIIYPMAGNFRGSQFSRFSWFSWLTGDPRKLNKKPKCTFSRRWHARTRDNRGRGHRGACRCWIDLTAGLLHTSSFLLSFFYTNVSSLDHMRFLCRFSISAKYKYDRSITCFWLVLTRVEPWCACSKRRSITDNVGGATLERLSMKIRLRNLWRWAFRENWIPRKFLAIWSL